MKKILAVVGCGAFAVVAAACSSGGGGGKSLSAGTYVFTSGATAQDDCQYIGDLSQASGSTFTINSVTATAVAIDFGNGPVNFTRSGTTLDASSTLDIDWTTTAGQDAGIGGHLTQGYNCMEHDNFGFTGAITGKNALSFALDDTFNNTAGTAADCVIAENSAFGTTLTVWPCESKGTLNAKKQ